MKKKKEENYLSLEDLPYDCISHLLLFIHTKWIVNIRLVSKTFNYGILNPYSWTYRTLTINYKEPGCKDYGENDRSEDQIIEFIEQIQPVRIMGCKFFHKFLFKCKRLNEIHFMEIMLEINKLLDFLKNVRLNTLSIDYKSFFCSETGKYHINRVNVGSRLENADFDKIPELFPRFEQEKESIEKKMDEYLKNKENINKLNTIKNLSIAKRLTVKPVYYWWYNRRGYEDILQYIKYSLLIDFFIRMNKKSLKEISILNGNLNSWGNVINSKRSIANSFEKIENIQTINLNELNSITERCLKTKPILSCKKLQIEFKSIDINNIFIQFIHKVFPNLEKLEIGYYSESNYNLNLPRVRESEEKIKLKPYYSLKELKIFYRNSNFSRRNNNFFHNYPDLEVLKIAKNHPCIPSDWYYYIRHLSFEEVFKNYQNLKELDCQNITIQNFKIIGILKKLEKLKLDNVYEESPGNKDNEYLYYQYNLKEINIKSNILKTKEQYYDVTGVKFLSYHSIIKYFKDIQNINWEFIFDKKSFCFKDDVTKDILNILFLNEDKEVINGLEKRNEELNLNIMIKQKETFYFKEFDHFNFIQEFSYKKFLKLKLKFQQVPLELYFHVNDFLKDKCDNNYKVIEISNFINWTTEHQYDLLEYYKKYFIDEDLLNLKNENCPKYIQKLYENSPIQFIENQKVKRKRRSKKLCITNFIM